MSEAGGTKARNTSAILRTILIRGPIARSRIAEATGLSHASLSRLTTGLVAQRYLREIEPARPAEAGRPLVPIDFDTTWLALGIHFGRDRTTFAAADLRGRLVAHADVPHPEREPEELVAHALRTMPQAVGPRGRAQKPMGLGVSVGGWVDPDRGVVVENDALGWRDVDLRSLLTRKLAIPVLVESNVRAMALAELWFGAATNAQSLVYVFIGNVVGAAVVIGRTIHRGPLSAAGGIAHMRLSGGSVRCACGRYGCFQAMAADMDLVERAFSAGVIRERSIHALIAASRSGNDDARALLDLRARAIGEALAAVVGLINPDLVVLAGSGVSAAPEFFPVIRAEAERRCVLPIDAASVIRPAAADSDVLGLSATALVLDAFYRQALPPARTKRTLSA